MDGVSILGPDISDVFSEMDSTEKESGMAELVSFLKSAFQPSDFKKVLEILRLREKKFESEKVALKLEIEKDYDELIKKEIAKAIALEKELEAYRNQCLELQKKEKEATQQYTDLEIKLKELEFNAFVMEGEINKNKNTFVKLENRIVWLEEDHRVACESEQSAKEKLAGLLKEMEKHELECGKRRAEREIENDKRCYGELGSQLFGLKEDNLVLDGRDHGKIEAMGFKVSVNDVKCGDNQRGQNEERIYDRMESVDAHRQFEGKILNYKISAHPHSDVGSITESPFRGSEVLQVAAGSPLFGVLSKPMVNDKNEKTVDSIDSNEGSSHRVKRQLSFEPEGSSYRKVASAAPSSKKSILGVVIDISDSEDEIDRTPARTTNFKHDGKVHVLMASQNRSNEGTDGENGSSCEENFLSIVTPKRKRASRVIASESEDDDDDGIPISKLKMKRLQDLTVGSSDSPRDEPVTPSRRRLVSLRECEEIKAEKRTSPSRFCAQNLSPDDENVTSGINAKGHEVEDVGSDSSEGESLSGFIVNGSDDSISNGSDEIEHGSDASDDLTDPDSALDEVIARIRRSKDSTKWEYEADMLSSFSKDPELCMKAVCALYRQQTVEEKSTKESIYANRRGFSKFDALRASTLAEFLTEGDPHGPLKKSVEELKKHDPRALDYCLKLASHYSKQLFEIYQNKEDPLFLPS